jgi:hypothetical protein
MCFSLVPRPTPAPLAPHSTTAGPLGLRGIQEAPRAAPPPSRLWEPVLWVKGGLGATGIIVDRVAYPCTPCPSQHDGWSFGSTRGARGSARRPSALTALGAGPLGQRGVGATGIILDKVA